MIPLKPPATILVAPLNWGLGHATRCVPVIRRLLTMDGRVIIAAEGHAKTILQSHFPNLLFIELPTTPIRYPRKGNMTAAMLRQLPSLLNTIRREHRAVQSLISQQNITHIISDNRYGVYSRKVKSVLICHHVNLDLPSVPPTLLNYLHRSLIHHFDELWIPDFPVAEKLSGALSNHSLITIPVKYTGVLSRFTHPAKVVEKKFDIIALLSGPEPQRTLFEEKVQHYMKGYGNRAMLVRGIPGKEETVNTNGIIIRSSISDEELTELLHPDTLLVARSGYSTLMDMVALNHSKCLLIPTPGQTEQEYLAGYHRQHSGFATALQNEEWPAPETITGGHIKEWDDERPLKKILKEFL